MRFNLTVSYPETPPGKRRIKRNIYGNTVGYVSGRRFWEFGDDHKSAEFWEAGASLEDAKGKCWLDQENEE